MCEISRFSDRQEAGHVQIASLIALVSQIGVVLESEGELAIAEVVRRFYGVVEPLEEESEWEETLIECYHDFRVRVLRRLCKLSGNILVRRFPMMWRDLSQRTCRGTSPCLLLQRTRIRELIVVIIIIEDVFQLDV